MSAPTDTDDIKQTLAMLIVVALASRADHNPGNGAKHIAKHACDLVDELEKQFTERGWMKP